MRAQSRTWHWDAVPHDSATRQKLQSEEGPSVFTAAARSLHKHALLFEVSHQSGGCVLCSQVYEVTGTVSFLSIVSLSSLCVCACVRALVNPCVHTRFLGCMLPRMLLLLPNSPTLASFPVLKGEPLEPSSIVVGANRYFVQPPPTHTHTCPCMHTHAESVHRDASDSPLCSFPSRPLLCDLMSPRMYSFTLQTFAQELLYITHHARKTGMGLWQRSRSDRKVCGLSCML